MNNHVLDTNGVISQQFNEGRSHELSLLANSSRVTKKFINQGNVYIILFLTCFPGAETQRNRWHLPSADRRSNMGQSFVVLWRHTNICCYSIWPIVLRAFLSGSCASFRRRQVDYHSSIIESHSRHFYWLACTDCNTFISMKYFQQHILKPNIQPIQLSAFMVWNISLPFAEETSTSLHVF